MVDTISTECVLFEASTPISMPRFTPPQVEHLKANFQFSTCMKTDNYANVFLQNRKTCLFRTHSQNDVWPVNKKEKYGEHWSPTVFLTGYWIGIFDPIYPIWSYVFHLHFALCYLLKVLNDTITSVFLFWIMQLLEISILQWFKETKKSNRNPWRNNPSS